MNYNEALQLASIVAQSECETHDWVAIHPIEDIDPIIDTVELQNNDGESVAWIELVCCSQRADQWAVKLEYSPDCSSDSDWLFTAPDCSFPI